MKDPAAPSSGLMGPCTTYGLHCSSFFWFNPLYIEDPKRQPQKGTTRETIGTFRESSHSESTDYPKSWNRPRTAQES